MRLRRLGIDTYRQPVVYMRADCPVCRAEGFEALAMVEVHLGEHSIVAVLNVVTSDLLARDEASLSEVAWAALGAKDGDRVTFAHPPTLESFRHVRGKMYGERLDEAALEAIVGDVRAGRYTDAHVGAFLAACAGDHLDVGEITSLTRAMVRAGERLRWDARVVLDKHCVGGLPGNRTTPIVVAIVAAAGWTIPKTSSRAITSPAGTADTMETMAPVDLDLGAMRRVVEREGGCVVWGGAMGLSPVDDVLIRVEQPLDLDSRGQLVASILSKKLAAGATHVLIDVPWGPTAKVRGAEAAAALARDLREVGETLGLAVRVVETDGRQPVGRGVGPALEARDVLAVLRGDPDAPADLRDRAVALAGEVLQLVPGTAPGAGRMLARDLLADGRAWRKFVAICEAQGGLREPPRAPWTQPVVARYAGRVAAIDNRRLARAAKLAGAPKAAAAGLVLHAPLGTEVLAGQPLYTLHAEAPGELEYALAYAARHPDVVRVVP
ncbi:MAG: thymidine phosphorylase family protein [Myxococcota bacterium]